MNIKKTCRICLALDVKVFKLGNTEGKHFIENIFKQNGYNQNLQDFHSICFECKALLDKSYNFIKRVLKAQEILFQMVANNKIITSSILNQVDRRITGLNLVKHFSYIDIFITEDESRIKKSIKKENIESTEFDSEPEIECKPEVDFDPDPLVNKLFETNFELQFDSKSMVTGLNDSKIDMKSSNFMFDYVDSSNSFLYGTSYDTRENYTIHYDSDDMSLSDLVKEEALDNCAINVNKKCIGKRKSIKMNKHKKEVSVKQSKPTNCKRKLRVQRKNDVNTKEKSRSKEQRREQFEYGGDTVCSDSGQMMNKPEPKYPAKCEHCSYEIPNRTAHFHHYLIEHKDKKYPHTNLGGKQFVCQFCGIVSTKKSRHIDHELTHGTESNFTCAHCPKRFANRHRLQKHTYRSHPVRMLECDYCGKKVKARESLMIHIRMHTGEKPFKCPLCGAGFAHRGNIRPHIRANHEHYLDQSDFAPKTNKKNQI